MYEAFKPVTLKTGEVVECGVVTGPDDAWAGKLCALLGHKGEPWDWQNSQCVTRRDLGIEARFYVLHRGGVPLSNILTAELRGVGLFGHVFTKPEDRRKHATSLLMDVQMADFKARGGRALYLGTGFDSAAYHIYRERGFTAIEPGSGVMTFHAGDPAGFEREFFGGPDDPTRIEPVGWRHWPVASPLFCSSLDGRAGVVKLPAIGLVGRNLTEEALLRMIRRNTPDQTAWLALRNTRTDAVVGIAGLAQDANFPGNLVADVYCHPHHWAKAGDMLRQLNIPSHARCVAYADAGCPGKLRALGTSGFTSIATLPAHTPADAAKTRWIDAAVFGRQ